MKSSPAPVIPPIIYQASPSPKTPTQPFLKDFQKLLTEEVNDLHWLNNNELSYTFFDPLIKQRTLVKINITNGNQTFLVRDVAVKLSELFWSQNNNLLIFDYGDPYITYQYDYINNKLTKTTLNGYGYSWSPDGDSVFFYDLSNNPPIPKIFSVSNDSFAPINIANLPPFQTSFWSKTPDKILLYNFDLETGVGQTYLLNLSINSVDSPGLNNVLFPTLSPSGDKMAYASAGGIYLAADNKNPKLVYETKAAPQFISFAWIDNDQLIVFDGEKSNNQFSLVQLQNAPPRVTLQDIPAQTEQRARFVFSPDSNIVALSLDKDGLWIIKKSFLNK